MTSSWRLIYFPLVILGHFYVINWGNFIVFIILTFSRRWNFFQFAHCTNFHSIHVDTPINFSRIYSGLLINLPKCRIYASVNWVIIGSGNGLSPAHDQAIAWTNARLFSNELPGTNFYEIQIGILPFSFKKCIWKCRLPKWLSFCPGELIQWFNSLWPSDDTWHHESGSTLHQTMNCRLFRATPLTES